MDRVLVVLPNWFGETLFATPFLRALRQQCPQAFIATLGRPACREILLHSPRVNECIDYHERGIHRSLAGKWALLQSLRARRFDTAFILRKSLSRSLLLALAGIPARIGFAQAKSGWLLTHRLPAPASGRQAGILSSGGAIHKASTYLPLLEVVGLSRLAGAYEYVVVDEERRTARELLQASAIATNGPMVILHPGANWPHKRWAPERFAALGDRLVAEQRVVVCITGGPDDMALAQNIQQRMRHPSTILAGRTTLRQLGACLEQARLVISNDTGVLHMAAALRRPLIALYGPTSPRLTGPLGDPQHMVVLHHPTCCPQIPCYHPDRPPHPGMNSITVDEVYNAACQLVSRYD